MATMAQERELRELARLIKKKLRKIYGDDTGFFLNVSPFSEGGEGAIADYISNVERSTAIQWMEETVDRFNKQQDIPASKGMMQ